jgi:hypothetical protein
MRISLTTASQVDDATPTSLKQAFDKIDTRLTASINQLALAA